MSIATAVEAGTDLVEYYFAAGWTDGLPVVPPTPGEGRRISSPRSAASPSWWSARSRRAGAC